MSKKYKAISSKIDALIQEQFAIHPLSHGVNIENSELVLSQYFAMSQAFPYLQAGAQKKLILNAMDNNEDLNYKFEYTSVVGNFLCWDETGGHAIVRHYGNEGLAKILNTDSNFHANMLRKDIKNMTGKEIKPFYSSTTVSYLKQLLHGLESLNHIKRCAYMVAFENHAGIMIDSLWDSLSGLYNMEKNDLIYFKVHVGGADPAEPYHIEMTERMVSEIVSDENSKEFVNEFINAYALNYNWCESIKLIN